MADNKNLQSRRVFFKKATKKLLPIVSIALLGNIPGIVQAGKVSMGCEYGCQASCYTGCFTACSNHACRTNCTNSCSGGCERTCFGTCSGTCYGTCERANTY